MPPPNFAMDAATDSSVLSPCRSKRGVCIYRGDEAIAFGHNDQVSPFECTGTAACKSICRETAVHAEQFALLQAGKEAAGADLVHVKTVAGLLVPSGEPSCVQCSKLMIPAGILGVWLYHADGWRRHTAVEFHQLSVESKFGPVIAPSGGQ